MLVAIDSEETIDIIMRLINLCMLQPYYYLIYFILSVILKTDVELASSLWIVKDGPITAVDNVGYEPNPEANVVWDTTVMQRLDAKIRFTRNNEAVSLITLRMIFYIIFGGIIYRCYNEIITVYYGQSINSMD